LILTPLILSLSKNLFVLSPLMEDGWAGIQRGFTPAGIRGREIVRVRGKQSTLAKYYRWCIMKMYRFFAAD
jgi:hypothetical protein